MRKAVRVVEPPRVKSKPKPRVKIVVVPKPARVAQPKVRAASYPRCGGSFLKQGTWCTTGGNRICRVAFVRFSRGSGSQSLMGCKQL